MDSSQNMENLWIVLYNLSKKNVYSFRNLEKQEAR